MTSIAGEKRPSGRPRGPLLDHIRLSMVLGAVVGAAGVLVTVMAILAPLIRADVSLSRFQFGTLATTYFGVGALASLVAGRAIDTLGSRRLLAGTIVLAGTALIGIAASTSYPSMLAFCALAGVALSASNPVTNTVILAALREGERGTVMGLKQAGVPLMGAVLSLALPAAAATFGWRTALVGVGVVVLALVPLVIRVGTRPGGLSVAESADRVGFALLWLGCYAFLMGAAGGSATFYMPLYGHEAVGLSIAAAGAAAGLSQLTAVAARIVWTRFSERAKYASTPLVLIALSALAAVVPMMAAQSVGASLFWLAAVAAGLGLRAWTPVAMLAGIRLVEPARAGSASGIVIAGFYSGLVLGPAAFGYIVDSSGGYGWAWCAVAVGFVGAAGLALRRRTPKNPDLAEAQSVTLRRAGFRTT